MFDYNSLVYFIAVVQHNGFTSAARNTGMQKSKLSKKVFQLEQQLGIRLLHRTTRSIALTDAGEQFYKQCLVAMESANAAFENIALLKKEPVGVIRMSCPVLLAQTYLAKILPDYLIAHPNVTVCIEATDRNVNLIEERLDLALRAKPYIDDVAGLVAKNLGTARRILVASPSFLKKNGVPKTLKDVESYVTIARITDTCDNKSRWNLHHQSEGVDTIFARAHLISNDLKVQLHAAIKGVGIALLPEPIAASALKENILVHVLPDWSASQHIVHLIYPRPRGMLPSVRSFIDYLAKHSLGLIQETNK
jgi:DNA-binding transcriptional LysR family regulator